MEISAIASAISGIKNASDIAKFIKDSGASLEAAEIKLKLAELIESLADTKMELADIKDTITLKEKEIKNLKEKIALQKNIVWEEPYYWIINEDNKKEGPFCQRCYDSDKKLIRLQSPKRNGYWICSECKNHYADNTHKPPKRNIVNKRNRKSWINY